MVIGSPTAGVVANSVTTDPSADAETPDTLREPKPAQDLAASASFTAAARRRGLAEAAQSNNTMTQRYAVDTYAALDQADAVVAELRAALQASTQAPQNAADQQARMDTLLDRLDQINDTQTQSGRRVFGEPSAEAAGTNASTGTDSNPAWVAESAAVTIVPGRSGSVVGTDARTGSGYVMYTQEQTHSRFGTVHGDSHRNLVSVVRQGETWFVDDNTNLREFTPRASDRLLAAWDFSQDTVTSFAGTTDPNHRIGGIAAGYLGGDLRFTSNRWYGSFNDGETQVDGTTFTVATVAGAENPPPANPQAFEGPATMIDATTNGDGVRVSGTAGGPSYVMFSAESVQTRVAGAAYDRDAAEHLTVVTYQGGEWFADDGSGLHAIQVRETDRILAILGTPDLSNPSGVVSVLSGVETTQIQGIAAGVADTNLALTPAPGSTGFNVEFDRFSERPSLIGGAPAEPEPSTASDPVGFALDTAFDADTDYRGPAAIDSTTLGRGEYGGGLDALRSDGASPGATFTELAAQALDRAQKQLAERRDVVSSFVETRLEGTRRLNQRLIDTEQRLMEQAAAEARQREDLRAERRPGAGGTSAAIRSALPAASQEPAQAGPTFPLPGTWSASDPSFVLSLLT